MDSPFGDRWKKRYDFNPNARVTTGLTKESCPTVSPFEKKPEEPKPPVIINNKPSTSSNSFRSSFMRSPFRSKQKQKEKSSTMTSSSSQSSSIFSNKSNDRNEEHKKDNKDKPNGCKPS